MRAISSRSYSMSSHVRGTYPPGDARLRSSGLHSTRAAARPANDALQLLERLFGSGRRRFSHSFLACTRPCSTLSFPFIYIKDDQLPLLRDLHSLLRSATLLIFPLPPKPPRTVDSLSYLVTRYQVFACSSSPLPHPSMHRNYQWTVGIRYPHCFLYESPILSKNPRARRIIINERASRIVYHFTTSVRGIL